MEILHKAKRKDNGEWVEGFYCQLPKISLGATIIADGEMCAEDVDDYIIEIKDKQHSNFSNGFPLEVVEAEAHEVDPQTVCVYTGKNDEKGKNIWQHDYVAFIDVISTESGYAEYQCAGEVVWDEETASFQVTDRLSAESYEVLDECCVIGNSFDNPDMLEDYL